MNWKTITRFLPEEFPEDPETYAESFFLQRLNAFAVTLDSAVFPSPVPGALARFDGSKTSRHYAVKRKVDAVDIFCNCPAIKAWATALKFFNGVGIYFDTCYRSKAWPMLHVDLRPTSLIWYRDNKKYYYPGADLFYKGLAINLSQPIKVKQ